MRGEGGISPNLYLPILIANKEKIIFTMIYINTTDVFSQIGSVSEHLASFFNHSKTFTYISHYKTEIVCNSESLKTNPNSNTL